MNQLKFDTIQLVTSSQYLFNINEALFKHTIDPQTGEILSVAYYSHQHNDITPYELCIRANSHRLTIEFSSKILLAAYPQLICADTFRQCLSNIEALGICKLDIDGIIVDCYFNKLHVTADIDLPLTDDILSRLNQCTGDYRRYKWHRYNEAIVFTRNVKAADCRESITLYNKEIEMLRGENRAFLVKTGDTQTICNHFVGKTRLEVKLENKRKIQKELDIPDTDYQSVMGCGKNIVLAKFNEIFGSSVPVNDGVKFNSIGDYGLWCIIRYHSFDLQRIEQEIKDMHIYGDKTRGAMGKQMKKIKAMIEVHLSQNHPANDAMESIREKLLSL